MTFSKWEKIETVTDYSGPAVYRIRLIGVDNKPIKINRWIGTDLDGIIYIGKTENLKDRLDRFNKGFETGGRLVGKSGHPAGNMIFILNKVKIKTIPLKNIQYQFEKKTSEEEAKKDEDNLIKCYVEKHGEVPPLNSNIPNRNGWLNND